MSNSTAVCLSYKAELMQGYHNFGTTVVRAGTGPDTFKAALFLTTASLSAATTVYSASGEVSGTNYAAGGITVPNTVAPVLSNNTACWTPSASIVFSNVTITSTFDSVLLYNASQQNRAILVTNFGAVTSVMAGNFTLSFGANVAGTALLNFT